MCAMCAADEAQMLNSQTWPKCKAGSLCYRITVLLPSQKYTGGVPDTVSAQALITASHLERATATKSSSRTLCSAVATNQAICLPNIHSVLSSTHLGLR